MEIVGSLAFASSVLLTCVGLGRQARLNYKLGRADIDHWLGFFLVISYVLWTWHGWNREDWYLLTSQIPGCLFGAIIVFQIFYYRRKKRNSEIATQSPPQNS